MRDHLRCKSKLGFQNFWCKIHCAPTQVFQECWFGPPFNCVRCGVISSLHWLTGVQNNVVHQMSFVRCATSLSSLHFFVTNTTASYLGPVQNHICGAMIDALIPIIWTLDDAILRFFFQDIPDATHVEHLHDILWPGHFFKTVLEELAQPLENLPVRSSLLVVVGVKCLSSQTCHKSFDNPS